MRENLEMSLFSKSVLYENQIHGTEAPKKQGQVKKLLPDSSAGGNVVS